jgi:4a-hydroxytetrahydrobiopterin dehydratase
VVQDLSQKDLEQILQELDGWHVADGKLHAEFQFDDFVAAFGFMTKVALAAESADHHPEWSNVYNRVRIDLVTHEAGDAITERDVDLARTINRFR